MVEALAYYSDDDSQKYKEFELQSDSDSDDLMEELSQKTIKIYKTGEAFLHKNDCGWNQNSLSMKKIQLNQMYSGYSASVSNQLRGALKQEDTERFSIPKL